MNAVMPVPLGTALHGFEGKWVALKGGSVVAAAETLDRLLLTLRESQKPGVQGATVLRVPAENEAELVGLG